MDDIVKEAADNFKIRVKGYQKSKAAFLLDTEKGFMLLRRHGDCRKIEELYKVTEALYGEGFNGVERYMTQGGKPYVSLADGFYTLSTYGEACKFSLADTETAAAISKTLARFHKAGRKINVPSTILKTAAPSYYHKRIAEARHIKKWLDKQSRLTDIDVLYIKKFGDYLQTAEGSSEKICGFYEKERLCLCFSDIKEDSVCVDSLKNVTLVNFESCALSVCQTDLCRLIRRFVKRGGKTEDIGEILRAYHLETAISCEELDFIKAYLAFPHKFFSITNKYYNGKKIFESPQTFSKLKADIYHQDRIYDAINNLEPM